LSLAGAAIFLAVLSLGDFAARFATISSLLIKDILVDVMLGE
jgi:hypothetical protein